MHVWTKRETTLHEARQANQSIIEQGIVRMDWVDTQKAVRPDADDRATNRSSERNETQ